MQKIFFIFQAVLCLTLVIPQLPASESMHGAGNTSVPHYVVRLRHRLAKIRARNMPSKAVMKDVYKVDAKCPYCYLYGKKNCPKCAMNRHHKGHYKGDHKGHHKSPKRVANCKCGGEPSQCPCKTCKDSGGKNCLCGMKKVAKKACQTCKLYGKANCSKCSAKKAAKKSCKTYGKANCAKCKAKKPCKSCKVYSKANCAKYKAKKHAKKSCKSCKTYGKANSPKCKHKSGSIPRGKLKIL